MISSIAKAIRLLSSDVEPFQLSLGICFGIVAGLSPLISVQSLIVVLCVISFRVNLAILLMSYALFSLIAYLADPLIVSIGTSTLAMGSFKPMFTEMYNSGIWRFLNFNNTAAMGSLVISIVMFIPLFIIFQWLITRYRQVFERYLKESAVFSFISKSKLLGKVANLSEKID